MKADAEFSGKRLRKLRDRKKFSVARVADATDVDAKTVTNWEGGRNAPHINKLPQLARLFRVRFAAFFE